MPRPRLPFASKAKPPSISSFTTRGSLGEENSNILVIRRLEGCINTLDDKM